MIRLAELLDSKGIKYIWTVFTNSEKVINNPNIVYMKPKLDIRDYIADNDFLVQLSDGEAYCYSAVESLMLNTAVIVTDLPVFRELGIDSKHGIVLDLDFKDINEEDLTKEYTFTYTPPKSDWAKIITKAKSVYDKEKEEKYIAVLNNNLYKYGISLKETGRVEKENTEITVSYERLEELRRR